MEPVLAMFILFVLAPLVVFRGIRSLRESRDRSGAASGRDGASLRQSELQAMIDTAVLEATIPLVGRIEELERELLMGHGRIDPSVLADALGAPEADGSSRDVERPREAA